MSISSGFRLLLILRGGSSSLYFGPFYHITFLKRRPIVIKVDFWCTRPSSEAFSRFSSSFLFLVSIQCAVPTPPSLDGMYQFSTHPHPPTPASCACQMSLAWLSHCCFCHSYSCLPPFFGLLPDFCGSCFVIACLPFCPFSHPHTLDPCPM